jgi:hypothetical protein
VKEVVKDCKTLLVLTPQEKGWSLLVNQIRGVNIKK